MGWYGRVWEVMGMGGQTDRQTDATQSEVVDVDLEHAAHEWETVRDRR